MDVTELGHKSLAHHMGFDNTNVLGMVGFTLLCSLYLTCKSALSKTILFFSIPVVNQIFMNIHYPELHGFLDMF